MLAGLLLAVALVAPRLRGTCAIPAARSRHAPAIYASSRCWCRCCPARCSNGCVGRGRPFVGGEANAFNFRHFAGTEAYASFPSGHAITRFALAFAVSAIWPQARLVMIVYAVLIALTRLVLLAHHPSDVVAGALVGVIGAMAVRYWFAARRLGFAIRRDGAILPLPDPRWAISKGLPATRRPHKKRTPRGTGRSGSGCRPTQTMSVDLPSSDTSRVAVSIVVPVRNEAENVAPADRRDRRRARRPMGL